MPSVGCLSLRGPLFLLLLLFVGVSAGEGDSPPEVQTGQGSLRGQRLHVPGSERPVDVFLGVPFAPPPLGPLRFSPPGAPPSWTGTRDAQAHPPMCLQDPVTGQVLSDAFTNKKEKVSLDVSEDCLYLNIFSPVRADKEAKKPVMVWIHGGGLLLGAASTYDGSALAAFEDVVVVAIQYRLGILGFLSTGDDHVPGNLGFLDQVAALKWVQGNIGHFGGDPGSVTIFGESAGGFSTSAHVLSPLSKGLFHRAISESGVAAMDVIVDLHPERLAKKIAQTAGCQAFDSAEMLRCLKGKTAEEILETTLKMEFTHLPLEDNDQTLFMPAVVDGVFLPKRLLDEKGGGNGVPYIIGVNNHEAGWLIPSMIHLPDLDKGFDRKTAELILRSSAETIMKTAHEHHHIIVNEYLKDIQDPLQLRDQVLEALGDVVFVAPAIRTARHHRDAGHPTYVYEFRHSPSWHAGLRPDFVQADHGDEVFFVFGKPFLAGEGTEKERTLSKTVMKYWANFARNGDPNGPGLVTWPSYGQEEQYLDIGLKQKVAKKLKEKQVRFWTQTLPEKVAEGREGHSEL
ncbi:fatty acyl-CoA hydrolase precursor, medium chain isoform X2 [Anolis carolinensis]|uniref:fatty acyl-CoA hydrolase precursor, medium chain isoform X2 n=1 Tax=Anolis carolinensis TaxID=28377 RepID=UPI002F2B18B2